MTCPELDLRYEYLSRGLRESGRNFRRAHALGEHRVGKLSLDEELAMTAQAGEKARQTGDFRCEKCHHQVHVTQGKDIPKCPNCGNDTYDTRYHETSRGS